jgi:hypothetical protein
MKSSRVGRPIAAPKAETKSTISVRVAPTLKERLNQEATKNDRSISAETELRLEISFRDELLERDQGELYGRASGDLLRVLWLVMRNAGTRAAWAVTAMAGSSFEDPDDWLQNPVARYQAIEAAITFLEGVKPKEEDRAYPQQKHAVMFGFTPEVAGQRAAISALWAIKNPDDINKNLPAEEQNAAREAFGRRFHPSLGPLIEKIPVLAAREKSAGAAAQAEKAEEST